MSQFEIVCSMSGYQLVGYLVSLPVYMELRAWKICWDMFKWPDSTLPCLSYRQSMLGKVQLQRICELTSFTTHIPKVAWYTAVSYLVSAEWGNGTHMYSVTIKNLNCFTKLHIYFLYYWGVHDTLRLLNLKMLKIPATFQILTIQYLIDDISF